jgi:hypothetical protein
MGKFIKFMGIAVLSTVIAFSMLACAAGEALWSNTTPTRNVKQRTEPGISIATELNRLIGVNAFSEGESSKRYELIDESMTWENAKLEAERRGGHLAIITCAEQQKTIEDMVSKGERKAYWIGAYRNTDNKFVWLTGKTMDYTNWAPGQPDNSGGKVSMVRVPFGFNVRLGHWDDEANDLRGSMSGYGGNGFIIEYPQ